MGINLGQVLGVAGQALGGIQGSSAFSQVLRTAGAVSTIASAAVPVKITGPGIPSGTYRTSMAAAGPVMRAAGAVATVGRSFFQKFPNLATAIQNYRNAGMKQVTRGRLYGLLRRFGPELIISGGILTAAAVSELMMAGPGTRRMNPANVKALRRSVRRVESFHKLCRHVDVLRSRGKGKKCSTRGGSQQFVRQG